MLDRLRGLRLIIISSFKASPRLAIVGFVLEPLGAMLGAMSAVFVRGVVDGITNGDTSQVTRQAAMLGAIMASGMVLRSIGWRYRTELLERTGAWFDARILELTGQIPGLEHHERADYHDKLQNLEGTQLGNTLFSIIPGSAALLKLFVISGLLATLHPVLVLLPLFGVPNLWLGIKAQRIEHMAWESCSPLFRRANGFYELTMKASSAKELRILGIDEEIRRRHRAERDRANAVLAESNLKGALNRAGGWLVFGFGYLAALALVSLRVVSGSADIGDLMLAITLAAQLNDTVTLVGSEVQDLLGRLWAADNFIWLEKLATSKARAADTSPPSVLEHGIDLIDVSFTYPGTDHEVLREVNLHLPAGARVAIVGDNGAGKTTLVKLLCGFYEPTAGRILADRIDLARVDAADWRENLAGGFQDYCRFEFTAGRTVGLGDLPRLEERPAIEAALDRAGGSEVPGRLREGFDTQLGRSFDDGVDLSMGQWQKLALGRAFMRDSPVLLVLDEPTASLDAPTEHALFERYAQQAEARRAVGAITLLVSHRFSTVRSADMIVVVDDGKICELGNHSELIAKGGLYAELFELQASAYREPGHGRP